MVESLNNHVQRTMIVKDAADFRRTQDLLRQTAFGCEAAEARIDAYAEQIADYFFEVRRQAETEGQEGLVVINDMLYALVGCMFRSAVAELAIKRIRKP